MIRRTATNKQGVELDVYLYSAVFPKLLKKIEDRANKLPCTAIV